MAGSAATLLADATGPTQTPSAPERLAALAASLPAVSRESYQIGREVAKGGIGRVVVARDKRLDRPVALKELLVWNEKQEQRFVREALLTARLQHPAIVPIYEAGRWPDGEPFYAMKLVSGRSLADLVSGRDTLPVRLSLLPHVIAAAQAVAFAHSKRIIHRDLKPANVLVGELGETVVIDWGLAKDLADAQTPDEGTVSVQPGEGLTLDGAVMGTPAYMPPEQAQGRPVDERADVYALGAMLYHVLAAVPPHHDVPPERLLATLKERPPKAIEALAPEISDELAAIVNKAMARDPDRRYPTAKELATDLERFQTGQVVAAHTYTAKRLLFRYWKRNRAALSVAASALALVTLVVLGALVWSDKQRRFAEAKQREAEAASAAEGEARSAAQRSEREATARADEMTILQAHNALDSDPNRALAWLKTLSPEYTDAGEIRRIASDARARGIARIYRGHDAYINHIALSPDGRRFATASDDKTIRVWDTESGESTLVTGHVDEVWNVDFFPDGKEIVSCSKDGTSRRWALDGKELARQTLPEPCRQVIALPSGDVVGSAGMRGAPWSWRRDTGKLAILSEERDLRCSAFSQDGGHFLTVSRAGELVIHGPGAPRSVRGQADQIDYCRLGRGGAWAFGMSLTHTEHWTFGGSPRRAALFDSASRQSTLSKSQKHLIAGGDSSVVVMAVDTGEEVRRYRGHASTITAVALSDDDRWAASASGDGALHVWNVRTGEARSLSGFASWVTDIKFLPGSESILAASAEGELRLFSPPSAGKVLASHERVARGMAVSRDGKIATLDDEGTLFITSSNGEQIARHRLDSGAMQSVTRAEHGDRFAACWLAWRSESDGWVPARDATAGAIHLGTFDGAPPRRVPLAAAPLAVAAASQSGSFFVGLLDGSVVRIAEDGEVSELARLPDPVTQVRPGTTDAVLAVGTSAGDIRLIHLGSGAQQALSGHKDRVYALAFLPDGKTLASGSADHTLRLWDIPGGASQTFDEGGYGVAQALHSRTRDTLYLRNVGESKIRRLSLDPASRLPRHLPPILPAHRGTILAAALSGDGRRLLTAATDGTIGVIDLSAAKARLLRASERAVLQVQFLPGDREIVSLDSDGQLRLWPDDLPETMPELRAWIDKATPERITDP